MIARSWLRRGAALAALLPIVAAACDSETIELLQPAAGASVPGTGGMQTGATANAAQAGAGQAGAPPDNRGGASGAAADGGEPPSAGTGGDGACEGFGCGGFGGGFGGTAGTGGAIGGPPCYNGLGACTPCVSDEQCGDWHCSQLLGGICVQCTDSSHCKTGSRCDGLVGRCAPSCEGGMTCRDGRQCDPQFFTCVLCINDEQCAADGDPDTAYCAGRRCVECTRNTDCTRGEKNLCVEGRCVECFFDKDCGPDRYCSSEGRCQ